jgi:acetone carboxylase, gamma subunit
VERKPLVLGIDAGGTMTDTRESLDEIYPGARKCDPEWMELREYYCPRCKTQLEVEAVTPGYPVVFDFEPDLEGFYRDWLKKPL